MTSNKVAEERKGFTALIVLTFGFASIAILARILGSYFSIYQQLYLTVGAAFLFCLVLYWRKLDFSKLNKIPVHDWGVLIMRVSLGYIIGAAFFRQSVLLTKISNVTFIQSLPVGALIGFFLFQEKLSAKKILYVILAFLGVILISIQDYSSIQILGKGELFSLISTICFSLSFAARKWQTKMLNNEEMTTLLLFIGTIGLCAISLILKEVLPVSSFQPLIMLALLGIGFFNAINGLLINFGYQKVPVVVASNILTLEAVFATILALLFFRELPNLKEIVGGIIIITSVIQMNKLEEKEKLI